ncbi:hypothetical protein PSECIP111854_01970 [Pseudoalteromonas sp. CIP111854]|uniref:Uncharacterized protein n=1 Tax=Pseudoalteromonas holothuriae TaxID=2963714 RepID=A0A9W4QXE4_9GAMM|nr:hypothetical protein [Pseudoalteromonas sp. CIP111854]CAH9057304.1 hypothetical protein PSECIP111854_01970 [Pseudoalteromonas sp. CIP111854]
MNRTIFNPNALSIISAALLFSGTALSSIAAEANIKKQENGQMLPTQVSAQTWQAISNWSTDSLSLLEFIASNDEEYELNHYIELLTRDHRDGEILRQLKELDTTVLDYWPQAMNEASPEDNFLFTRYIIQYKPAQFVQWLNRYKAISLSQYLEQKAPQLFNAWYEEHAAPKRKGLSILEYNSALPAEVYAELKDLLSKDPSGGTKSQCACQMITPVTGSGHVVTNYPATPSNWSDYSSDSSGLSKHKLDFKTTAYGAFHSGDGVRWSKHKAYGYDSSINHNSSEFYVKMLCTDAGGFDCNQSNSCTGNLEVRGTYSSRYHVKGTAKQIWSKATNSHAGDGAKFAVDLPGSAPEIVLFNKAGGAAMSYNTGWDINSVLGALKAALGITSAIVSDSPGSLLDGELASDLITNIAGMVTRSGNEKTVNSTMRARFDSSDVSPFLLQPNEVYHFTLDSSARVKARGYGGYSDSHFEYGSSGALMYAANHFTCGTNVTPPTPTGLWFYADQSGPDSNASLRSDVENWLSIQLNKPVSASQSQGIVH